MTFSSKVNKPSRSKQRRSILAQSISARPAFTLVEVMLVLALLVVIGALIWPAVKGPFEGQRLRKAGDQVRAEWTRARTRAMKSGRTQVFQFQTGKDSYTVQTWTGPGDDEQSTREGGFSAAGGGFGTPAAPQPTAGANRTGQLPEGVTFVGAETTIDQRAAMRGASNPAAGDQSEPILFYPDGTTSTVHVVIANQRDRAIVVSLRGLTGLATCSDIKTVSEATK
ncbi:MAG TPA: prepilin-type N-terminal cleavage/methylation domain-containing protein [Pirellulaceae bacterium]|nr:prepilin-type N-terminal cleavage/methylation domain-containing protein [Pirellulaceae bacterium]